MICACVTTSPVDDQQRGTPLRSGAVACLGACRKFSGQQLFFHVSCRPDGQSAADSASSLQLTMQQPSDVAFSRWRGSVTIGASIRNVTLTSTPTAPMPAAAAAAWPVEVAACLQMASTSSASLFRRGRLGLSTSRSGRQAHRHTQTRISVKKFDSPRKHS